MRLEIYIHEPSLQTMVYTYRSPLKVSSHLILFIYYYYVIRTQHKIYPLSKHLSIQYSIVNNGLYVLYTVELVYLVQLELCTL